MSSEPSRWFWGYPINGRAISTNVRQSLAQFQPEIAARQSSIAIVRFEPPPNSSNFDRARFDAARVSMNQKIKAFEFLGCGIEPIEALPFDLVPPAFDNLIDQLNSNPRIRGIIVQYDPRQDPLPGQRVFETITLAARLVALALSSS